jgi:hypothetical protein
MNAWDADMFYLLLLNEDCNLIHRKLLETRKGLN